MSDKLPAANQWLMVGAEETMARAGGGAQVLRLCREAKAPGYDGLLLWDPNLWDRRLPPAYAANARVLREGLAELGFSLFIEMAPCRNVLGEWSDDPTLLEPRPSDPHPDEKNRRWLCLSHPGVFPIWEEQLKRAEELYHPTGWLLGYDEIMVAARDARCRATGKTAGQLLAAHARQAADLCRRVTPGRVVAVWNDMFDPHANARENYYHAAGGFREAWEGIGRDVLILNWTPSLESCRFWSARSNRQILAGYYDRRLSLEAERQFVSQARSLPGMAGWMYTTWQASYRDLASWGSACGSAANRPAAPPLTTH